jgi:hypothetical protein
MREISRRTLMTGASIAIGEAISTHRKAGARGPDPEPAPSHVVAQGAAEPVDVADLVVPSAGRVSLRVPVRPGLIRSVTGISIGGTAAQADNVTTDLDGWVRGFTVSAIIPGAGRHRLRALPSRQAGQRPTPSAPVTVTINGRPPDARVDSPDFRDGPVCRELVYRYDFPDDLHVHVHQRAWADGASEATVVFENGWSEPGNPTSRVRRSYRTEAQLGSASFTQDVAAHSPYARWLRRLGPQPVAAQLVPIGWSGDVDEGTWEYFKRAKVIPNYAVDPGRPNIGQLDAVARVPFPPAVNGAIGPFTSQQGMPGDNPDIGLFPIYHLHALRHLGEGGFRMLRDSADLRQGSAYFIRSKTTKTFHRPDEGRDHVMDQRWVSPRSPLVGPGNTVQRAESNQSWELAHWGSMFYLPYLVSGELACLEGQVVQELVNWLCAPFVHEDPPPPAPVHPHGSQLTRHPFTNRSPRYWDCGDSTYSGHVQERHMGWGVRTTVQTIATLPDDDARTRALLGWDKSAVRTIWANVQRFLNRCYVLGSTSRFPPGAFRRTHSQNGSFCSWMQGTILVSLAHGCELGAMTPEGITFTKWFLQGRVDPILDPKFRAEWIVDSTLFYTTKDRKQNSWASPPNEGIPAITNEEVYLATAEANAVPVGTVRPVLHDPDWAGYWADAMVAAVDLGVPRSRQAHEWFKALALRTERRPYLYGVKHAIAPRAN